MRTGIAKWLPVASATLCAVPAVLVHTGCQLLPEDDAYINFRYVDNILAGLGPVYNEGERVFGSTTPLFVGWLTLLQALTPGVSTEALAVRSNLVPLLALAAAFYVLVQRLSGSAWLAAGVAAYCLLQPLFLYVSISGMETMLFLALAVGSLAASVSRRPALGALLAAGATLTRPEGGFCLVGVALACLGIERRSLLRAALAFGLPLALWTIPAWLYFGSPVPHSVVAKAAPLYPLPAWDALGQVHVQLRPWTTGPWLPAAAADALLVVLAGVAALALGLAARAREVDAWIAASLGLALLAFYPLANPLMMVWYWPAVHVAWLTLAVVSLVVLARRAPARFARPVRVAAVAAAIVWLAAPTLSFWARIVEGARHHGMDPWTLGRDASPEIARVHGYRDVARWLNALPQRPRIAAPEIGALGYHYEGPIFDLCGLVSPEAVAYLPVPAAERHNPTVGAISSRLVEDLRPDVIVTLPVFAERGLFRDPAFRRSYREVHRAPLPAPVWFGSDTVQVFARIAPR